MDIKKSLIIIKKRVPEEQGPKSVVIDRNTYGRLLKACNYKTKDEQEEDRARENEEQDRIVVSHSNHLFIINFKILKLFPNRKKYMNVRKQFSIMMLNVKEMKN